MSLYNQSGYVDIDYILSKKMPFNFVTGGRGTGKTYGALLYVLEHNITFMFMRRTQSQIDIISRPEFSPFKSVIDDYPKHNIIMETVTKYNSAFYRMFVNDDGEMQKDGDPIGYTCALSTISNLRGFDASNVDLLIYDEFIPERHERTIKNEGSAFLNAYETINRNRELKGKKPLQVLCLANANSLGNALFTELGLIDIVDRLQKQGREEYISPQRGVGLFLLNESPISNIKRTTALYKLTNGSAYGDMALSNEFAYDSDIGVEQIPLRELSPIVSVSELTIYKHKSKKIVYVSTHYSGGVKRFESDEVSLKQFRSQYHWIAFAILDGRMRYESQSVKIMLNAIFT